MGKAKANSRAAEKKRERLEMEKKMNARVAIVKAANNTSDPLENLPSFKVKLLAFAHFRFDMDYDDEVLYVYEIQLEDCVKRKGLGKFMMQVITF